LSLGVPSTLKSLELNGLFELGLSRLKALVVEVGVWYWELKDGVLVGYGKA